MQHGDGSNAGNLENPIYDAFGGQGIHVAPSFPSDIAAPPLLMPVPGAGYVLVSLSCRSVMCLGVSFLFEKAYLLRFPCQTLRAFCSGSA